MAMPRLNSANETILQHAREVEIISNFDMLNRIERMPQLDHIKAQTFPGLCRAIDGFVQGELVVITGATGCGKCHGKGAKIMMYDCSIKNVEDIIVGDELMGDDSRPRTVLNLARGSGNLYKIIQNKADDYVVNGEHVLCLQRTRKTNSKRDGRAGSIVEVDVGKYLKMSKTMKHILKGYKVGVDWDEKKVKLEPYLLGLWLGDGHSNNVDITTADDEIVDYLKKYADSNDYRLSIKRQEGNKSNVYRLCDRKMTGRVHENRFLKTLRHYNLIGNKHIPSCYIKNSRNIRLNVLAGLLDSDGYKTKANTLEFVFVNEELSNNVVFLCRSLGFRVSINHSIKTIKSMNFKGRYFRIIVSGNVENIPCLLNRKKPHSRHTINPLRSGISVKSVGYGEYYGFTIDGNGRYLLGDFTVTHNTLFCQSLTKDFCHDGVIPLWFTFEVSARFFLPKFALNAKDLQFYMPADLMPYSVTWVSEVIKRAKKELGIEVAFIDHLHYIFDMSNSMHASLDIGMVVRTLKRLCVEQDITIFLCCHTTKSRVESNDEIGLHKIRDSSLVAQEADTVIFVHRTTSDDGICKTESSLLKVCKARRTGDMSTVIETIKQREYLAELA